MVRAESWTAWKVVRDPPVVSLLSAAVYMQQSTEEAHGQSIHPDRPLPVILSASEGTSPVCWRDSSLALRMTPGGSQLLDPPLRFMGSYLAPAL
jgi:hypothetical protein